VTLEILYCPLSQSPVWANRWVPTMSSAIINPPESLITEEVEYIRQRWPPLSRHTLQAVMWLWSP